MGKYLPGGKRRSNLKTRYGITTEQFDNLLIEQLGQCLICENQMKDPVVDHCHTTGVVRGLLCRLCNASIGGLKDDPAIVKRAYEYLLRCNSIG